MYKEQCKHSLYVVVSILKSLRAKGGIIDENEEAVTRRLQSLIQFIASWVDGIIIYTAC